MKHCFVALACLLPLQPAAAQEERIDWLKRHSVRLQTIDAASADFRDLEPLIPQLAGVRVIQLAELSHGDGNGSAARVRLIRFLHERLGFNVLVWEAGFYEADLMNALLAGDTPLPEIPSTALWWFWSYSKQIAPLFAYARSTSKTSSPLRMAGFDLQFSGGPAQVLHWFREVHDWFERVEPPLPVPLRRALQRGRTTATLDTLLKYAPELFAHFESYSGAMDAAHGARQALRMRRILYNAAEYLPMMLDRDRSALRGPDSTAAMLRSYNRRERVNAENVLWLANEWYRGEKLIIWSHNVHAAHTRFTPRYDALVPGDTGQALESTGRLLKQRLGDALYSIGTIAHEGEWGFPGDRPLPIHNLGSDALEATLNQLGREVLLLDLRAARATDIWLRKPMPGSLSTQVQVRPYPIVWPEVFDGLLFIRRMKPHLPRQ